MSAIAIPDNWADLTAEEKYEVARALLVGAAADTGLLDEPDLAGATASTPPGPSPEARHAAP